MDRYIVRAQGSTILYYGGEHYWVNSSILAKKMSKEQADEIASKVEPNFKPQVVPVKPLVL